MREKRLSLNTLTSLFLQLTTIVCGFILPRLILNHFGSEVNGLVNSITQFLAVISFFELGVGAVVQSALYKPLADKDNKQISCIMASAGRFFKGLAYLLFIYVVILCIAYPRMVPADFDVQYTAALIIIISISSFAQYYFGIVNNILLSADQRGYIHFSLQAISIIVNTIVCAVLLQLGCGIHIVKLTTSLIYIIRPIILQQYVKKHYAVDRRIVFEKEPIQQKWNGVAQHLAAYVLDNTDVLILSLFSTLSYVSIYSVYHFVVYGVKQLIVAMTNGIQSLAGELWAKQKYEELNHFFGWVEWAIHTGTIFAFGCTSVLIVPFVQVYTIEVHDIDYVVPLFAFLITIANMLHCLKTPYQILITACNHFRQTQSCFMIAAIMNLLISIVGIYFYGLTGVAVGTLIAMLFQTIWMVLYDSKHLIQWPIGNFLKQITVDILVFAASYSVTIHFSMKEICFFAWFLLAVQVAVIWLLFIFVINVVFYRHYMIHLKNIWIGKNKL